MWTLLESLVIAGIVLVAITEFFIPLLKGRPLFGSFRKVRTPESSPEGPLAEKLTHTKAKVEEVKMQVKEVQDEATTNFKTAEQLKEESDNLLK